MSDIKTTVDLRGDFTRATGQDQQQNQNTGRGAPDRVTPEFNRAAAGPSHTDPSRDQPVPALNREPSQADLQQGGKYDLANADRVKGIEQQMQQQRSRNQDQSLGR